MSGEILPVAALHLLGAHLVFDEGEFVAACPTAEKAGRVAELVDRHGLVDVPDDASSIGRGA